MNQQLKRLVTYIFILGFAALFAVQWGPGSRGCEAPLSGEKTDVAATVNQKDIPLLDFQRAYAQRLNALQAQGITDSLARQFGLPNQVLEQLITVELLAQYARSLGVEASDDELREFLQRSPAFQKDGHFDEELYKSFINYQRTTAIEYEKGLRRELTAQKVNDLIRSAAVVSEAELKARFQRDANKANLTFVRFLPEMFLDRVTAPKPEEVAAYAKDHATEVSDAFTRQQYRFQQPERVRARHVLIKFPEGATEAQRAEARTKIENLKKELDGGKDFAALATEFSEDTATKEAGGDLGFNDRSAWVPAFADAAFKLEPGKVSEPVETQFGFHLIKVEEKRAAESKELKDVEGELARELLVKERARRVAEEEAQKALAALQTGKSLATLYPPRPAEPPEPSQVSTAMKPETAETGEFSVLVDVLPKIGPAPEVLADVAALQAPSVLGKVYPSGDGYLVGSVTLRERPDEAVFAQKRDELRDMALSAKRDELSEAFLRQLRADAKIERHASVRQFIDQG